MSSWGSISPIILRFHLDHAPLYMDTFQEASTALVSLKTFKWPLILAVPPQTASLYELPHRSLSSLSPSDFPIQAPSAIHNYLFCFPFVGWSNPPWSLTVYRTTVAI